MFRFIDVKWKRETENAEELEIKSNYILQKPNCVIFYFTSLFEKFAKLGAVLTKFSF